MPDLIKVAKFGGTSMADLEAMRRCAKIVAADHDKKVIVVSATSGTTNMLTHIFNSSSESERTSFLKQIQERHITLAHELETDGALVTKVEKILEDLERAVDALEAESMVERDHLLSFGERLSSVIFAEVLNELTGDVIWLDAREVIITDDFHGSAEPHISKLAEKAEEKIIPIIKKNRIVSQGFIGSTEDGVTTTLGRGGSDYSAALFAEAIEADVLEIWTDVTAIYSTDPRIVSDARPITEITFDEAAELSTFGAKVLHPATLKPAIRKSVKVYVGSSIHPDKPGTWIVKQTRENPVIRAISLRRDQTLITIHSLDMLHRFGYLARIFEILAKYKISVDLVTTSEVSVSLTLDTGAQSVNQSSSVNRAIEELRTFSDVRLEKGLTLIALVGNKLHATAGLSGPVFGELQNINIRLICHGASSHNLCFLVDERDAEGVVRVLHKKFITEKVKTATT